MKKLATKGAGAYEQPSEPLDYILSLIRDQAANGADYIAVNVDAFGEQSSQLAADLMRQYVRLVRRHGQGVPVCIDSSATKVLKAGLEEWYAEGPSEAAVPLVNSVTTRTAAEVLPWRRQYRFKVVGMLVDEEGKAEEATADKLHELARTIFAAAMKYGFAADDLFFDTTTYPLAIDMPLTAGTPSFTYRAFQAIKKIRNDPEMQGVHCSLGVSNCVKDLPARKIGVCRAYVQRARECGLDAGIVNVKHGYGTKPADPELLALVDAFAQQDGSAEASTKAMTLMGEFCSKSRK